MLIGIVRLNRTTRQYSFIELMATQDPVQKPVTTSVNGKVLGSKRDDPIEITAKSTGGDNWPSDLGTLGEASAVEQMIDINRRLVIQIETLRLKVDVDARQHQEVKDHRLSTNGSKLKAKQLEMDGLKTELKQKDGKLSTLTAENQTKASDIELLQKSIDELKEDVMVSKNYADQMQSHLDNLHTARDSLHSGSAYAQKDEEIRKLQQEVDSLKQNLHTLEKGLIKSKERIAHQGGKLRLADMDRINMQFKYKEELSKVTHTMRNEVERMRDVMRQQWEEMRKLRKQNDDMHSDIKEIRELLSAPVPVESNQGQISQSHIHSSSIRQQPLQPSLPALSKRTRQTVHVKNKKKNE